MTILTFLLWAAAIGATAGFWAAPGLMKRRRLRLARMANARADFFQHAMRLTNDRRTPDSLIQILEFMAEKIDDRRLARAFLMDAFSGRLARLANEPSPLSRDLRLMPDDLRQVASKAIASFIFALCFSQGLTGLLLRRATFYSVEVASEPAARIVESRAAAGRQHGFDGGGQGIRHAA